MNETIFQPWYDLYSIAIFELNPIKLVELADATDKAIQSRLRDLQYDSDHHEERRIIDNAQRTLAILRADARNTKTSSARPPIRNLSRVSRLSIRQIIRKIGCVLRAHPL